jgi:type II secretory pathway pseudopilin PulG
MTLLELLLALAITILTGAAAAAVTLAVARSMTSMTEGRSVINRANLVQARLRGVTDTAWCALEYDPKQGLALWAGDDNGNGRLNVSELRILWINREGQMVTVERVKYPDDWTAQQIQDADLVLAAVDDPFGAMLVQRGLSRTATEVIGDRLNVTSVTPSEKAFEDSKRVRLAATIIDDGGDPVELLLCLGLPNHQKPQ